MKQILWLSMLLLFGLASAKTFCLDVWTPVCGVNGITYSNSCYANQAHIKVAYNGMCIEKPSNCIQGNIEHRPMRDSRWFCFRWFKYEPSAI